MTGKPRDLPGDIGLLPTTLRSPAGPYVGTPIDRPPRRLARLDELNTLLLELRAGFDRQYWWPAETPYEVMVGAVLTQNTMWRNVELALTSMRQQRALTPARVLSTDLELLGRWIRPSGYYRMKAKKLHDLSSWYLDVGGLVSLCQRPLEPLRDELLGVWGVGPETADSILCYAAGRRTPIVDAYTRRLLSRHGFIEENTPYEELRQWLKNTLVDSQAVYEEFHALCVRVGAVFCKPAPRCVACPATTPPERT